MRPSRAGPGRSPRTVVSVTRNRARTLLTRYAVAWLYLGGFAVAGLADAALDGPQRHAVLWWASTDVVNLHHDPAGSLIVSAFITDASWIAWLPLIALALFGANAVLGNWRTAVVCAAGQVLGTLVSEGIVDYRLNHGLLPAADERILDVGPSYVVVSAITVALLYGSRWARVAAAADLAILVFVGRIFSGLSTLQVAAVGHTTAIAVAAVLSSLLLRQQRRRQQPPGRPGQPGTAAQPSSPRSQDSATRPAASGFLDSACVSPSSTTT
jgi:rhomboid family protein